jgi:hypothetical protein
MSMARTSANYIGPFSTNSLISMVLSHCLQSQENSNWSAVLLPGSKLSDLHSPYKVRGQWYVSKFSSSALAWHYLFCKVNATVFALLWKLVKFSWTIKRYPKSKRVEEYTIHCIYTLKIEIKQNQKNILCTSIQNQALQYFTAINMDANFD